MCPHWLLRLVWVFKKGTRRCLVMASLTASHTDTAAVRFPSTPDLAAPCWPCWPIAKALNGASFHGAPPTPPGGLAIDIDMEKSWPGLLSVVVCLEPSTLRRKARLLLLLLLRKAALPQPIFLKLNMAQLLRVAADRCLPPGAVCRFGSCLVLSSGSSRHALDDR